MSGKRQNRRKAIGTRRARKDSPEVIESILADLARGLTRSQACAAAGINQETFAQWERRPEYPDLRAKAEAARIKYVLDKIESCDFSTGGGDWKRWKFFLEKAFPKQFGDDPAMLMALQQNNFYSLPEEQARLINERVQRLQDETS
jgi:hypothetical protein